MKLTACRPCTAARRTPAGTPAGTETAAAPSPGERELVPGAHDVRTCSNSKAHRHQCRTASRVPGAHGSAQNARAWGGGSGGPSLCADSHLLGQAPTRERLSPRRGTQTLPRRTQPAQQLQRAAWSSPPRYGSFPPQLGPASPFLRRSLSQNK